LALQNKQSGMAIYRFRVEIEDYEGIYREIEVKTTQTFEDLHYAVLRAFSFDLKHPSSFFYSDDLWHMEDEIAFKDMVYTMSSDALPANKTRISDYVDDPHQRFIFVYQSEEGWAFLIELVDIDTNDGGRASLPATVKSVGEAPKQYNTKVVIKPAIEKEKSKPSAPAPELLDELDDDEPEAADELVVFEGFDAERGKGKVDSIDLEMDLDDDVVDSDDEDSLDDEDDNHDSDSDDDDDFSGGSKGRGKSSDFDDNY